jgi:N-acetylglucosamine-6-phosphate deacetylase
MRISPKTESGLLIIQHCRVVLPDSVLDDATIVVKDGVISEVTTGSIGSSAERAQIVDAGGNLTGPGFVDPHCHGDGLTRFFDDPDRVVNSLLRNGTTSVLATLGYPDMIKDGMDTQLRHFNAGLSPSAREVVLGVHLEGPYINRKYGAQTTRGIIKGFDSREYLSLLREKDLNIRWWTCAPELAGSEPFIEQATQHGVVVAAGHTEATAEQILRAVEPGLRVITHWTNATGNLSVPAFAGTRSPGIDEIALVCDPLNVEIIPDKKGCHVHPLMVKLLYRAKRAEGILIITDAGYRREDDLPVTEESAMDVSIDGDGNLAGSRLSMSQAAKNFWNFSNCSLPELFRMAALNTARLLKMDHLLGSIEPGKRANLVILDAEFNVRMTFLHGRMVYSSDQRQNSVGEDQSMILNLTHKFEDQFQSRR